MLKKLVSMLLAVSITVSALPAQAFAAPESGQTTDMPEKLSEAEDSFIYPYGDANTDGRVDLTDLLAVNRSLNDDSVTVNNETADVNVNGSIDREDQSMVEDFILGSKETMTSGCKITFISDGQVFKEQMVQTRSHLRSVPKPEKEGYVFDGWYADQGYTQPFFYSDAITSDMTVYAKFREIPKKQEVNPVSFAIKNAAPDVVFYIKNPGGLLLGQIQKNVSVRAMNGDTEVIPEIISQTGYYEIRAKEGYVPGQTYEMTIGDGLIFSSPEFQQKENEQTVIPPVGSVGELTDKAESIRTATFMIYKEEVNNLRFAEDLKFMQDNSPDIVYHVGGETFDNINSVPIVLNDNGSNEGVMRGTFQMPEGQAFEADDTICIYKNVHPKDRDYKNVDYSDDPVSYIKVKSIENNIISFESVSPQNLEDVIFMPDSIPVRVKTLPTADDAELAIQAEDYDKIAWRQISKEAAPEYDAGDFLIFYTEPFVNLTEASESAYGRIVSVEEEKITYELTTLEEMKSSMDMYLENTADSSRLLTKEQKEQIEDDIRSQVEESGFAEEAAYYLAEMAMQTDGFQSLPNIENFKITDQNGQAIDLRSFGFGKEFELSDDVKLTVEISNSSKYFDDGLRVALGIEAEFSAAIGTKNDEGEKENEMKFEIAASFMEEVAIDIGAGCDAQWKWYAFIPVLQDLNFDAHVDLKNFSGVSVDVKIYTSEKEDDDDEDKEFDEKLKESVKKLSFEALYALYDEFKAELCADGTTTYAMIFNQIDKINNALSQIEIDDDKLDDDEKELKEQLEEAWSHITKSPEIDGEQYDPREWYEVVSDALGQVDITSEMQELLGTNDGDTIDAGVKDLMERYSEMLDVESSWVPLVEQNLFDQDFTIFIVAIGISADFVIKANVNIALGFNMEYVIGKRYGFWFKLFSGTSGSYETDLLDEKFAFQFYVMGMLGLRMGIAAEVKVGIFSTKLASIGLKAEMGPFVKLWGYFIYEYTKMRPMSETQWRETERMLGALYVEFGLYLEINFVAQAFDGKFKYEPSLLDEEWVLLTAGEKKNIHSFGYELDEDEGISIGDENSNKSGYQMYLPEDYYLMTAMDLVEGGQESQIYSRDKFDYELSSRYFTLEKSGNPDGGAETIEVTVRPPDGVQYLEAVLKLIWKDDQLAFSNNGIVMEIPLVWTTLSTSEFKQKVAASVMVNNTVDPNDNKVVWSDRMIKASEFRLPSDEEVRRLMNYERYDENGFNLKYDTVSGYQNVNPDEIQSINNNKIFRYDVTTRKYTISVAQQKRDGSVVHHEDSAYFGQNFEKIMKKLEDAKEEKAGAYYTRFLNVTAENASGEASDFIVDNDIGRVIDTGFAKDILNRTDYEAHYADNDSEITYTFEGIEKDDISMIVKNGTKANDDPYKAAIDAMDDNVKIQSVSPDFAPVYADTVYTVVCVNTDTLLDSYKITFDSDGGTPVEPKTYKETEPIAAPADPEKEGYTILGWMEENAPDEELYEFVEMPSHDLNLKAKWEANQYTVTFDMQGGEFEAGTEDTFAVTYDKEVGTLPVPIRYGYQFEGWFTELDGGEQVTADTVWKTAEDRKLYAKWREKIVIDENEIQISTETFTYAPGVVRSVNIDFGTYESIKDRFKVEYYRKSSYGSVLVPKEEVIDAGTYRVRVFLEEDDEYAAFEKDEIEAVTIQRAQRNFNTGISYPIKVIGSSIEIESLPMNAFEGRYDGEIEYGISREDLASDVTWQAGRAFTGRKKSVLYNLYVRVGQGKNYLGIDKIQIGQAIGGETSSLGYTAVLGIKTSASGGTGGEVKGQFRSRKFTSPGLISFGSNFGNGSYKDCTIGAISDPWIMDAIDLSPIGGNWGCEYVDVKLSGNGKNVTAQIPFGITINRGDTEEIVTLDFQRNIESTSFDTADETIYLDSQSTGTYELSYDGTVTDQYGTYNALEHEDAPGFLARTDRGGYEQFIDCGLSKVSIDQESFYNVMKQQGNNSVTITVSLEFPHNTTVKEDWTFEKRITIRRN